MKCVFVGGMVDGTLQEVIEGVRGALPPAWRVAVIPRRPIDYLSVEEIITPESITLFEQVYRREQLRIGEKTITFYVHNEMWIGPALDLLFKWYGQKTYFLEKKQ